MRDRTKQDTYLDMIETKYNDSDNIFPKPMTDTEFRKIITDYLLGKDWYTPNPVSVEQCNVYIAKAIIGKYKGVKE